MRLHAQCTAVFTGAVHDSTTHENLVYANVYVVEAAKGAVCNAKGFFKIDSLCDGVYTVKVSHIGCNTIEQKIKIKGNTDIHFHLPHSANNLDEVNVVAKKAEEQLTQTKDVLSGKQLDETKGQSLGEALKKISGVSTLQTGASIAKPVIHGMHSNRILILNNGIRQEGQQWGSEHAPEIDPFIANSLSVIKGAAAVRYGSDAMAGVILVEPAPLRDSAGIGGEFNLVGFSNGRQGVASAIVQQNIEKLNGLTWRLQGTLKKAGNAHTPYYFLNNTGFEEQNFSAGLGYNKSKYGVELFYSQFNTTIGIFSGAHIGNLTDLQAAFNRAEPLEQYGFSYDIKRPYQGITHELFKAKAYLFTGDAGKLSVTYARQYNLRFEYDKHRPRNDSLAALNRPELQYQITTHTADAVWEHSPIKGFRGSIGLSVMYQENVYAGRFFIPNFINDAIGGFIIERKRFNKTEIEVGVRYDQRFLQVYMWENNEIINPQHRFNNTSGTIGVIHPFNEHIKLNVNVGTAWRAPGVNELYSNGLHHGAAAIEIGDRKLNTEQAYNSIATITYDDLGHDRFSASASVYYNWINNFIYLNPQLPPTLTIRGAFPTFKYTQTNATFSGIDLNARYQFFSWLEAAAKLAMVRAYDRIAKTYLVQIPADRYQLELTWKIPQKKRMKQSYFTINYQHVAKQWLAPQNTDFAPPPNAYNLFGFELGTTVLLGKQQLILGCSATNLFNTVYRDYMDRFRYYADALGTNISFRIKIPFQINK